MCISATLRIDGAIVRQRRVPPRGVGGDDQQSLAASIMQRQEEMQASRQSRTSGWILLGAFFLSGDLVVWPGHGLDDHAGAALDHFQHAHQVVFEGSPLHACPLPGLHRLLADLFGHRANRIINIRDK